MKVIDLRSDTVTLPSPEMRKAIAGAELGDDVFNDDPTVNRLEALAAEALGHEAALLTTSGTQSNLVAMLAHCRRGDEVIVGDESHILHHEVGGASALGSLALRQVANDEKGRLDLGDLEAAIRQPGVNYPRTGLVCLENTHNRCGGTILVEEDLAATRALANRYSLPLHLDGARLFNAAVGLDVPIARLGQYADSVCFSLCKGLGCPIGSVLCGSREFIHEARRYRKMLGGGMRQAGILAAAGIYALQNMVERLADDHANAQALASGLGTIRGVHLAQPPETNIVFLSVEGWDPGEVVEHLVRRGVLCLEEGGRIRMVTHYGIERSDVAETVDCFRSVVADRA